MLQDIVKLIGQRQCYNYLIAIYSRQETREAECQFILRLQYIFHIKLTEFLIKATFL